MHLISLHQGRRQLFRHIAVMLAFGLLSLLLGSIRFFVPGMDGGGSDMREIGMLMSVIFLPHWIYVFGVAFVGSLSMPFQQLEISTLLMHTVAGLFAWFFYHSVQNRVKNVYALGGLWAIMVVTYYLLFLIPTLVLVYYFFSLLKSTELIIQYKLVVHSYRYELFTTLTVTSLFVILYKMRKILEVRNLELEKALRKAKESDRLKTEFLTNISHEIRTPLNGIIGFSNLMSDPVLQPEERAAYSQVISSCGDQLLSIVSGILDLSTIKAGQVEVILSKVSVRELFDTLETLYATLAREKGLVFEVRKPSPDKDCILHTDKNKLKQILDNLLTNAFKFTTRGKVTLWFEEKNGFVDFSVEDTGRGIPLQEYEKVFMEFTKIEPGSERFQPGTGIGLSITRGLVELLGGKISLTSQPGEGSVFLVSLPNAQI
ncbi:MAG: HAMP domain-containing sensor histidine kinase [Bacteroidales bacterium]